MPAAGQGAARLFPATVGTVTSTDGRTWTVPAPVNEGRVAVDVYDTCIGTGDNPNYASQLETVIIDKDGVEITGFIHADNYFELYVNGQFVARDSIPMTPFNTSVVRFRARYPMTYAVMGVDWETHRGVGMEYANFNVGDAGFVAYFSDGNGTHADWRAETFYIAPLDDPACVRVTPAGRDSSFCSQAVRPVCAQQDPNLCKALHFTIPSDWMAPRFIDTRWPAAIVWPPAAVTDQTAYTKTIGTIRTGFQKIRYATAPARPLGTARIAPLHGANQRACSRRLSNDRLESRSRTHVS
jgi:hypothetical protein